MSTGSYIVAVAAWVFFVGGDFGFVLEAGAYVVEAF